MVNLEEEFSERLSLVNSRLEVFVKEQYALLRFTHAYFDRECLKGIQEAIKRLTQLSGIHTLYTIGTGKYYHLGLDRELMTKIGEAEATKFINTEWSEMIELLIGAPMRTVALLNGHTYAAGLAFACAHDHRHFFNLNREDGGKRPFYACMNEIDMPAVIPSPMQRLIQHGFDKRMWVPILQEGQRVLLNDGTDSHGLLSTTYTESYKKDSFHWYPSKHGHVMAEIRKERLGDVLESCVQAKTGVNAPSFFRFISSRL